MKKITLLTALTTISLFAVETEITSCMSCHGDFFEKSAMGYSKIVRDMPKEEIKMALNGYLNDSYGGDKKFLMKIQLKRFDNVDNVLKQVYKVIDPEYVEETNMIIGDKIEVINTQKPIDNYPEDSEIIQKVNLDKNIIQQDLNNEEGLTNGDPIVTENRNFKPRTPAPTVKVLDAEKIQYKTVKEETGNSFIIERVK